jgi:hypothetical protein
MDGKDPRILFCSDRRIGTESAGGDVCLKWDHAGDGWMAMLSGTVAKARSLAGACRKILMDRTDDMGTADIEAELTKVAHLQRRVLVENYIQSQLSIDYDYFLQHGHEQLPEVQYVDLAYAIRSIDLGCSLIIAGFVKVGPVIFTIGQDGSVSRMEAFAAIGCGALAAEESLYRREYQGHLPISQAAYYLYEAKRMSEVSGDVGKSTNIGIFGKSRPGFIRWKMLDPIATAMLDGQYKRFGPQEYDGNQIQWVGLPFRIKEYQPALEATTDDPQSPPASQE